MGVKVIDKQSQKEVEVSPAELQADIEQGSGRFVVPADGKVRVIREGNRTGKVRADKIGEALAEGWQLSDAEEVSAATIRREESDLASELGGVLESGLAGATLGGSTWFEANMLGMDPERMQARREAAGGLGTAAELAGALAPALITGGSSAAAQGAARAGLATRAALATPAGALARAGAGIERGLAGALGEAPALIRTVVPVAGRGAVEGFAAGVGAEIDDAVLGERELVAENLLSAGGMGLMLGGGAGALVPGLASAGAGLTKVPAKYAREILGKVSGSADDAGSSLWSRAVTDDNVAKWAHLNNLDPEDALLIKRKLDTPEGAKQLERYLNDDSGITEELAGSVRSPVEKLRAADAAVRRHWGGVQKMLHVHKRLPNDLDRLVSAHSAGVKTLDELDGFMNSASAMANASDLKDMRKMVMEARDTINAQARKSTGKAGAKELATVTHDALDTVKQGMYAIKRSYEKIARSGAPTRESDVMVKLLDGAPGKPGLYSHVKDHLEDVQHYGDAGADQAAMNLRTAAVLNSRRNLKGTASGRLLDPNRPVNNEDLLAFMKQSGGRFKDATKTELFEESVAAQEKLFDEALKRLDLSPEARAAIHEYKSAAREIGDAVEAQREKVRTLAATERMRVGEGNRSPSITSASTIGAEVARGAGTAVGATLGSFLGPVGGLAGAALGRGLGEVASLATRPYALVRKLAAIRARSGGAKEAQKAAMGGFLKQIRGRADDEVASVGATRTVPKTEHEAVIEAQKYLKSTGVTANPSRPLTTAIAEREAGVGPPPVIVVQLGAGEGFENVVIRDGNHRIAAAYVNGDRAMNMRVRVTRKLADGTDVDTEGMMRVPINPPVLSGRAAESLTPDQLAKGQADAPKTAAESGGTRNDRIAASRLRAITLASKLPLLEDEIRKMTSDMDEVAPNVAGVVASKTHKAVQFLASKAPSVYQPAYSTRPPLIDPIAAAEFERYVEACKDPMRTLSRLESGTFTIEHAETLRTVWPAVYRAAQQQCLDALATAHENGVSVPLATLTQMSLLFDVGADPTLEMAPAIAAALAAPALPPSPSGGASQASRPSAKVEIDTDRVASTSSGIGTME